MHAALALDPTRKMSQYIHDAWGANRGFIGGEVYAISQSADGYLWIGTERGLVRFDGLNFVLIQRPIADLPEIGPVRGLIADKEGNLWIRLDGAALLRYRDGKFENAYSRFHMDESTFTTMASSNDGGMLLSGLTNRAVHFHGGKFETVVDMTAVYGTVISLAQTRDGLIWLGTRDNGLFRATRGQSGQRQSGQRDKLIRDLLDSKVNSLLPTDSGGLWVGTDAGLRYWDGSGLVNAGLPSSVDHLQVLTLAKDRDANVWVGTDRGLLRITRTGQASLEELGAPGNKVTAVFVDRERAVWYGGARGIERLRDGIFTTYTTSEGLPSDGNGPVYSGADGRTWSAPISGGLFWLDGHQVQRMKQDGVDSDIVYSISGGDGEVWVGRQRGGLMRLAESQRRMVSRTYRQADGLAQDSVCAVHRNRDGTVWAGTVSSGLSRLKDGVFTNYSIANGLASNGINSIVEGFDGTMWFATANGLESFAGDRWINRVARDGLPSADVRSIYEDAKHVLWVATARGIAYVDAGRIGMPRGLPEALREQIFGFAEDRGGSLWIATSDHILRVNRDRLLSGFLEDGDVQSFGIADGLKGVEGVRRDRSVMSDPLGRIWVSANRGLAVADPRVTQDSSMPESVRIESMSAGGVAVDLNQVPKIASGGQNITFHYASESLSFPEQIRFRYKLDRSGLLASDRDWSDAIALRQVIYSHLGPGRYQFRVVASNADGLWNGPETTLSFVIEPAVWQTWWFRTMFLSVFLLAVVLIYRLRMYQLTRQLNVRFQERLAERTRIAQDLHDTLLQGFLSASMQLDVAEDQLPVDSPAKPTLRRILRLMGQVTEEGRKALQGLRQADADQRNLELAFSRLRQELAIGDKIGYRIIVQSTARPVRPLVRDEVYRIGREAVVNAFLHARATVIEVEVEYASRYLRILVRDDGCGIDPLVLQAGREGHWGLPGMRERSEGIGASLKLRSRLGAGTEVELTLPGTLAFEGQAHNKLSAWLPWLGREKFETASRRQNEQDLDTTEPDPSTAWKDRR